MADICKTSMASPKFDIISRKLKCLNTYTQMTYSLIVILVLVMVCFLSHLFDVLPTEKMFENMKTAQRVKLQHEI